jgi:predicted lipid-binding transport protein (Tim44 family)
MSGQGGKLVAGFVALHVLCCGLPLLIAAGAFTGAGALLGNGTLLAAGLLAVLAAAAFAVRRSRRPSDDDCCRTPAASDRGDHVVLSEKR